MSLKGKRILVTRTREQSSKLVRSLHQLGAMTVEIPVIHISPPIDSHALQDAVKRGHLYDWLIFTSVNGVNAFFDEMERQGIEVARLKACCFAAIGPATSEALNGKGINTNITPELEYRGEAVAQAIIEQNNGNLTNVSVLLPRASNARNILPDMLRQAGAQVQVVEAYRTVIPEESVSKLREVLESKEIDVATFTSSSTVTHTMKILGKGALNLLQGITIASIGPITTRTAREWGLQVDIIAKEYTIHGLVNAITQYFTDTN